MKFYLGVTDLEWYDFLSERANEDINFWQPGGSSRFKVIFPGAPFLFKLKSPRNAIGGIGFFSSHSILPLDVAWNIFGERNGVLNYFRFKEKIVAYRGAKNSFQENPNIGCIILTDPIFFNEEDWIETPKNWGRSIVQGKSYSTEEAEGRALWQKVELVLEKYRLFERTTDEKRKMEEASFLDDAYSARYLTKVRLGQGAFRVRLTDSYQRRCSITGEKTLPVLEAAHIKAFSESGPNSLSNGILLRADMHKLYDSGYITLTSDLKVEVSRRIKEEFSNGKEYYKYHGADLMVLPQLEVHRPGTPYIEWHNSNVYRG